MLAAPVLAGGQNLMTVTQNGTAAITLYTGSNPWSCNNYATALVNLSSGPNATAYATPTLSGTAAAQATTSSIVPWLVVNSNGYGYGFGISVGGWLQAYTAGTPLAAASNDPTTNFRLATAGTTYLNYNASGGTVAMNSLALNNLSGGAITLDLSGNAAALTSGGLLISCSANNVTIQDGTFTTASTAGLVLQAIGGKTTTVNAGIANCASLTVGGYDYDSVVLGGLSLQRPTIVNNSYGWGTNSQAA